MLALTRKVGDLVYLIGPAGERIEVKVLSCGHGRVVLGFDAPQSWKIWREEVMPAAPAPEGR